MSFALFAGMINGIYESAAAMTGLERWNDLIAQNLASAGVNGYKGQTVSFDAVARGLESFSSGKTEPVLMPKAVAQMSFAQGEMRHTENPHDFAIQGEGFFRLRRPDGKMVYTRDGEFQVSADGRLISKQGFSVLGGSGPIQVLPDAGPIQISSDGKLQQMTQQGTAQQIGQLQVYKFAKPSDLIPVTGGFATPPGSMDKPKPSTDAAIQQGYLESSNVSPIRQMVSMIRVNNAHQANQKMIMAFDDSMGKAIQSLATT